MIVCRTCGHNNPDDSQFCESCKSFLEFTGEKAGTSASGTQPAGVMPGVPVAGPAGSTSGSTTAGAGATGNVGAGNPVTITDTGTGIVADASMPPCPRCGTPNESTRTFCKYCGETLTALAPVTAATTKSRFTVDPRMAIGGAVVLAAIAATAVFALVLNGAKPAASLPPASSGPLPSLVAGSGSPPASLAPPASASPSPSASETESPSDSASPSDSEEPSDSVEPSDSEEPTESPTAAPPTAPTTVAFYAVRDGQADIFTIPPAGGDLTNLTGDLTPDSDPKWSPDGRRLVFDSRRVDNQRNIFVYEFDTTINQLTHDSGANNAFPTWSPDGQHIAYVHDGEIWVMNSVDGSDAHPLTTGADDSRPTWSESGQIAYHRTTPGNHEIWTVAADSSAGAEVLISVDNGGGRQPSWSPDGNKIAYAKVVISVLRIAVANADGSGQKTITTGAPCPCQFPTWSPNGKQIAFSAGVAKKEQIYVVSATGGTPKRITDGQGQNLAPGWGT